MEAETLNCPMCGSPASPQSTRCDHCGARLATVACPSCFGMMFVGSKFCSHCGAQAARTEIPGAAPQLCPRCRVEMNAVVIGKTDLCECPRCEGIWADQAALQQICTDQERQAAVLGMATPLPAPDPNALEKVSYVPCPVCGNFMNRVNFANCSHVVVDLCTQHGTWFDRDELRRIVEFIRAGGLDAARARQIAELEEQRRRLNAAKVADAFASPARSSGTGYADWGLGLGAAAQVLNLLFRGKQ